MSGEQNSCLYSSNAWFVEDLYEQYLADAGSVSAEWRAFFATLPPAGDDSAAEVPHGPLIQALRQAARDRTNRAGIAPPPGTASQDGAKQVAVLQLINAYRFRGHRRARLDPLELHERPQVEELRLDNHGLTQDDLSRKFQTGSLFGVGCEATLAEILDRVKRTYCRSIGAEYMHINDTRQKRWIQERLEGSCSTPEFDHELKLEILDRLIAANSLEEYLHTKYVGQKRFSLEGGESMIPLLDQIIQGAGNINMQEVVIGMAHRGRLNVLVNIIGKCPRDLFAEFEGTSSNGVGSGDVKYHLGYSSDVTTPGGVVHLTLSFNPSHLEIIDPVAEGSVRARQERRKDHGRDAVLPVLIHGDAAFAGQGVVMETLNLSQTRGYSTGGTIHLVVNNQIGFTTSDPLDSRSTLYCTDVAKMVQAPIFHVNGDDPEAVIMIGKLALEYRQTFHKDVVIDLVCYRRHGHSEADEPAATQPLMYAAIRKHPDVAEIYANRLIGESLLTPEEMAELENQYVSRLENNEVVSRPLVCNVSKEYLTNFEPYLGTHWTAPGKTTISHETFERLSRRMSTLPQDFHPHRAVDRIYHNRLAMAAGQKPMDWGFAETLAYASLVAEGYPVRLSGQDSERGTFFHRHAVVHDQHNGETYTPLTDVAQNQAGFTVINSILSEAAVLGFEFGYSSSEPETLVIWEAQFGDFANNAQVVIDQFISSCEAKWGRQCGLVLMLPHGYDGQGPEHSSARLERYLQLAAEENFQVCVPSTPAQMFHMLRRQIHRPYRRPLVIMSPKSLLRHPLSISTIEDITERGFQTTLGEIDPIDPARVERVLFCSGKVYFDLLETRRKHDIDDIAILRIEQQYPFPKDEVETLLDDYPNAREVVWVQEEPRNQGSWVYLLARNHLYGCLRPEQKLLLVARPYSASPAVGYLSVHLRQHASLMQEALLLEQRQQERERDQKSA